MGRRKLFVLVGLASIATAAEARAEDKDCMQVHARIVATVFADGCTSPIGLCTAGQIHGDDLSGTTRFVALGASPTAGMPGLEPPSTLAYSGQFVITTREGTLSIRDVGIFDIADSAFTELERVVGGTGVFAGATGTLHVSGVSVSGGTGFESVLEGELCRH